MKQVRFLSHGVFIKQLSSDAELFFGQFAQRSSGDMIQVDIQTFRKEGESKFEYIQVRQAVQGFEFFSGINNPKE